MTDEFTLDVVLDATLDKYTEIGRKRKAHRESQRRYAASPKGKTAIENRRTRTDTDRSV